MTKTLIFLFVLFGTVCTQAQSANVKEQKVDALNEYVNLLNEGIHGMLIVHRLLETYNQELNKYVDLESYQINNFSNEDLPKDIFEDPENWFYDTSPQEWKAKTISNKALTAAEKQNLAGDIKAVLAVLADINKIRFEVETLIATKNLEVRTEIAQVYEKLEEGVDHYEEFYKAYESINRKLLSTYKPLKPSQEEIQFQELYSIFFKIYMTTKLSLKYIREKDDEKLPKFISDLANGIQELSAFDFNTQGSTRLQNKKMLRARTDILRQAKSTLDKLKKFYNDGTVPVEFTDHGRYYFYYNSDVINNFNRYGNGVVFEMNRVFDNLDMPVLKFLEMPHYFKVLYPEEVIDTRPLAATNPNIKAAPENLKARKITPVTGKIIVDSLTFTIEIFDSKIKDGDVISFNYNKDWILNEQKLSDVAVKLRLKLNEDGKNFFILHSDDMGRNPPTTIGIRYKYGGEVKTIKLSSNLNTSEMIEIEYKPI